MTRLSFPSGAKPSPAPAPPSLSLPLIWLLPAIIKLDFDKELQICLPAMFLTCCKFHSS